MSVDVKLLAKIYDADADSGSITEANTFHDLLLYSIIGVETFEEKDEDDQLVECYNVVTLTKEDVPYAERLVRIKNGVTEVKAFLTFNGVNILNPFLSLRVKENGEEQTWGLVSILEHDKKSGFLKIKRRALPDPVWRKIPQYVNMDDFSSDGELAPGQIFNYAGGRKSYYRSKKDTTDNMARIGGMLLGIFMNKRQTDNNENNRISEYHVEPVYVNRRSKQLMYQTNSVEEIDSVEEIELDEVLNPSLTRLAHRRRELIGTDRL